MTSELIAEPLRAALGESLVHRPADFDSAVSTAVALTHPPDVVMTVGAGDVTLLAARIAERLEPAETTTTTTTDHDGDERP